MVFRIGTDAHLYDDPEDVNIAPLLDSKFDTEKCEALKRLLALIAQGFDVSNFFPQVVKNVASQALEVKKLVYVYLLHYAEKRPNEALLSINCFQKDLGDTNPLVRAWALRTMAGIRLHVIAPLVLNAVNKCARDPSVYVRKCAANALPKLNDLRLEENASAIGEIIGLLLNDNSPGVVGAAAAAFNSICPNNLTLIARNYRRLCETLPDVEEWGQIVLIGILLRFVIAKHGLVKESVMSFSCATGATNCGKVGLDGDDLLPDGSHLSHGNFKSELTSLLARSYTEGPDEYLSRLSPMNGVTSGLDDASFTSVDSNDDVNILLKCTSPLLWSHNSGVVVAAAGVHWIMAPKDDVNRIVKPLLFVLRSSRAAKFVVLCNILVFARVMPSLFADHYEDFFISASDPHQIKALKLEILSLIATDSSIPYIFQEFQDYIRDPDRRFAADSVAAIGLCAQRLPKLANICLEGLLSLTRHESLAGETNPVDGEAEILIQAVMSIKSIINQDPSSHEKVIIRLVRNLDAIKVPAARAIIIWLVGEYCSIGERIPWMLTSVLKYLAYCFTSEASETKLQILNTATKVLLHAKEEDQLTIRKVVSFVLELAKCDMNYDVRDRARALTRILSSILGSHDQNESNTSLSKEANHLIAEQLFGTPKGFRSPEPVNDRFYLPGSLSQIVLHAAPGYEPLPKPCSLVFTDVGQHSAQGAEPSEDSSITDNSEGTSGSLDEEAASDYSSQLSDSGSGFSNGNEESGSLSADEKTSPLIQISDTGDTNKEHNGGAGSINAISGSSGVEDMLSKRALESWLSEEPMSVGLKPSESDLVQRSASISIPNIGSRVKPKSYTLLDTASGQGLKVDFSFSSQISDISPLLVCVEVSFQNCSKESFSEVILVDEGSNKGPDSTEQGLATPGSLSSSHADVPTLVPMEQIDSLEPNQMIKRVLHVRFHHHLLPLKLSLWCNGKKHAVKLRPDIGYFVKPLQMDVAAFRNKESQLRGMFEYERRCTFAEHILELNKDKSDNALAKDAYLVICESLALKMLSNANLFLVSVDLPLASKLDDASGLSLRFSGEMLSSSVPCLITLTAEGNCLEPLDVSVKVNCEETVFGLNLLNRVVNFLAESSAGH